MISEIEEALLAAKICFKAPNDAKFPVIHAQSP